MALRSLSISKRNLENPDDVRTLPKTRIERVTLDQHTVIRTTFEPGWKWSECVKPTVQTEFCESPHFGVCLSGRLICRLRDGQQVEFGPGDVISIPPGHDGWVLGNEPFVAIDFTGGETFAR